MNRVIYEGNERSLVGLLSWSWLILTWTPETAENTEKKHKMMLKYPKNKQVQKSLQGSFPEWSVTCIFNSTMAKVDFQWIDFVKWILNESQLTCKVVCDWMNSGKSELNDKIESKNNFGKQKLQILASS